MNLHERTLEIENKIIDFLTMICWWTDVRFDISNLGWFIRVNIVKLILLISAICISALMMFADGRYGWLSFAAVIEFLLVAYFVIAVTSPEDKIRVVTRRFPQGFPNPSRVLRYFDRRLSFLAIFVLWTMIVGQNDSDLDLIAETLIVLSQLFEAFETFLLSCDSIPPAEKARRRAAREMSQTFLVPA